MIAKVDCFQARPLNLIKAVVPLSRKDYSGYFLKEERNHIYGKKLNGTILSPVLLGEDYPSADYRRVFLTECGNGFMIPYR